MPFRVAGIGTVVKLGASVAASSLPTRAADS
jgi:hypothetical protein